MLGISNYGRHFNYAVSDGQNSGNKRRNPQQLSFSKEDGSHHKNRDHSPENNAPPIHIITYMKEMSNGETGRYLSGPITC